MTRGGHITGLRGWKQQQACSALGLPRGRDPGGEQRGGGSRDVLAPHPLALALGTVPVQRLAEFEEACLLGPVRASSERVSASRPTSSLQVGGASIGPSLLCISTTFHFITSWSSFLVSCAIA